MFGWLWWQLLSKRSEATTSDDDDDMEDTRVIIVLNSDLVRTVQGAETLDELKTLTLSKEEEEEALDPQKDNPGRIALRLKQFRDSKVSVLGHVNHNLLSFLINILLSHKVKSLIMLKKTTEDLSLIDPAMLDVESRMTLQTSKQILRDRSIEESRDPESQDIFVYQPSRAERSHLEERF